MKHQDVPISLISPVVNLDGETVTEITMRPLTGKDIMECGFPYTVTKNARTNDATETVNAPAAGALIARSAGLTIAAVGKLAPVDFTECLEVLRYFFLMRPRRTSLSDTSAAAAGQVTPAG